MLIEQTSILYTREMIAFSFDKLYKILRKNMKIIIVSMALKRKVPEISMHYFWNLCLRCDQSWRVSKRFSFFYFNWLCVFYFLLFVAILESLFWAREFPTLCGCEILCANKHHLMFLVTWSSRDNIVCPMVLSTNFLIV